MSGNKDNRIENFAFDYLGAYYARQHHNKAPLVRKQEKTKQGYEVDGLFVLRKENNTFFTASLSYRQSDRLAALIKRYKRNGLGRERYITAGVVLFAVASTGYFTGAWFMAGALAVLAAITGFVLHSLLAKHRLKQHLARLANELRQAPGDERWLGISISSLYFRNNKFAKELVALCEHKGVGLITIGKRAKVVLMQEPRSRFCRRGDFLACYASEAAIRKDLSDPFLQVA